MKRLVCISCGSPISKSAFGDPYVCRSCESDHGIEAERYSWLDHA
jgi:hypothetical protein